MKPNYHLILSLILISATFSIPAISAEQASESDQEEYFAVFMEGQKVGYAIEQRIVTDGIVTTSEQAKLTISRAGVSMTIEMSETDIETTSGEPLGFEVIQDLGAISMKITGDVDKQGQVTLTTTTMGTEQKQTMQWPQGAVMSEGLRLLSMKKGLEEGLEYSVKIFSPGNLQAIDADIKVGNKKDVDLLGRIVPLTEMTTTISMPMAGNIVSTSFVDDELNNQKTIMPIAMFTVEMVACAKEFALGENDVLEMIDMMFLASPEPLSNVSTAQSIVYQLSKTNESEDFIIPSNDNQDVRQISDEQTILTITPVAAPSGVSFPYNGNDEEILAATKPSRYIQSDDSQIIELARKAIGDAKDAAEAAKKIEAFVAEYIDNKSLSVGYATASEVANSKQGDCSEFAVLTAAMCRAVGIPAQVVVGIAYVEDFAGHTGFGGHAWTQAYIGDKWIGLDAAFRSSGLGGYDAGHIALASGNGEPADFFNIATSLGRFKIDKITVKR